MRVAEAAVARFSETERALVEQLATLTQRNEVLAIELGILQERTSALEREVSHGHDGATSG
jgi:hypothetical protein